MAVKYKNESDDEEEKSDKTKPEVTPAPANLPAAVPEAPTSVKPIGESSVSLSGDNTETTSDNEEVTDNMRSTSSGLSLVETVPDRSNSGFIKNPLPGPKPHVARELTYDYDFKDDDLEFDITDMKGKDYYDI